MGLIKKIINSRISVPVIIILIIGINIISSKWHSRIDCTNEKRFTLSNSTQNVLKNIDTTIDITVLLSGDIKSEFKKLANSTKELLDNFKNYAGAKIIYKFEIPGEGLNDSLKAVVFDSLVNMGLRPTNQQVQAKEGEALSQRQIFPAAIIRYKEKTIAIDLLQGQIQKNVFNSNDLLDRETLNSAEALLEYKFANAIQKITQTQVPVIAYACGNGEPPYGFLPVNDLFNTLGSNFIIDTFNLKEKPFLLPEEYNAIVIVKPTEKFSEDDKFKLDQYVMQGGKLLFFVDVLYAERDSLQNGNLVAYSRDLNLSDLLFRYGARINTDLLADKHCDKIPIEVGSFGGQSQKQLLPWPYAPLLQAGSSHPLVKNQADVLGQFVNSIDTIDVKGINKQILLSTSNNTSVKSTPTIIALNNLEVEEDIATYNRSKVPVAILLEGKFSSLYANRASQAQLDTLKQYGIDFKREAPSTGKVIIVADADIVINQVSESIGPLPMGTNKYTRIGYANRDFFLNCTEYLANDRNVLEARAKDYSLRLLDNNKVNNDKLSYQLINILLPILLVLLFTILFQWLRKRKYSL